MFDWGSKPFISIKLDGAETKAMKEILGKKGPHMVPVYSTAESISGQVEVRTLGKKLEHQGIKVELLGTIEQYHDRNINVIATNIKELETPGFLNNDETYRFDFGKVPRHFEETYQGLNVRLRYFIRVTITRSSMAGVVTHEQDIVVQKSGAPKQQETDTSIKMEVGIEDCLHIEFEYDKQAYHLNDVILGKIYFLLVRIKIKHMELAVIKRESVGTGQNVVNESETLTKYELMDGAPVRGEMIPIRLFLQSLDLTPTMRIKKNFTVKYYLNLVLVDEDDRRYFKQQEVELWRQDIG